MSFKNIKLKYLILNLIIGLVYPLVKAFTSSQPLLVFSDTCTIIGLALLVIGVVNSFFLHGDLDITGFIANRALAKDKTDFDEYMKDQEEKRKDSFNYPLLIASIMLIVSMITAFLV